MTDPNETLGEYLQALVDENIFDESDMNKTDEEYEKEDAEKNLRPGMSKLVDLLIKTMNRSFSEQLILQAAGHHEGRSIGRAVMSTAAMTARDTAINRLHETYEHLVTVEDPLAALIELSDYISCNIAEMCLHSEPEIPVEKNQAMMSGVWNVVAALGHRWVSERDAARDECTTCLAKPSDPQHAYVMIVDDATETPNRRKS